MQETNNGTMRRLSNNIHPHTTFMKPIALFLSFFMALAFTVQGQTLSVASFNELSNDLDARLNYPKVNQLTGKKCAIIKVVTTQSGFNFDIGSQMAIEDKVSHPELGEIWIYVPEGTKKLKISHTQLGQLHTETNDGYYWFSPVKSACCYRLELVSGKVTVSVENTEEKWGYFVLYTDPDDVEVYLKDEAGNDVLMGMASMDSPFQKKLPYGRHTYRLRKHLYHEEVGVVTIKQDRVLDTVRLQPAFGYLSVTTQPAGAVVTVEGKWESYTTPCTIPGLASGSYDVRVALNKYRMVKQSVQVEEGKTSRLSFTLEPNCATITLRSVANGIIYLDGRSVGKETVSIDLEPGFYTIEATLANHRTAKQQIEVLAGRNATYDINPEPIYGSLEVQASPANSVVWLDGVRMGDAPMTLSKVLVGQHQVAITAIGYATKEQTVFISEGRTFVIDEQLETGKSTKPVAPKVVDTARHQSQGWYSSLNVKDKGSLRKDAFLIANAAYTGTQWSGGLTYGTVKRWGWFVSGMSGIYYPKSRGDVGVSGNYIAMANAASSHSRTSVIAGVAYKVGNSVVLKVGAGYGRNNLYWSSNHNWYKVPFGSYEGVDVSAGMQLHLGPVVLSAEAGSTNFSTLEGKFGLGVKF